MSLIKNQLNSFKSWLILALIWLLSGVCDRIWFALDHSIPAWDQADYLTGALNYWQALQAPHWLSAQWWTSFWQLSAKVPPLTYIATAVFLNFFGTGPDQATLVNLFFSAVLLISVYGLGVELFNQKVGLWAASLCVLLPGLYRVRLDFLLDYPLTALVTFSFWCLTVWKYKAAQHQEGSGPSSVSQNHQFWQAWLAAIAFGFSFGLAMLTKQTALMFLLIPLLGVVIGIIWRKFWWGLLQFMSAMVVAGCIFVPWYRTNWLLILTAGKRATVDSAIAEGDPGLHTLQAWTYYWHLLPSHLSWPLLLVPMVGYLLWQIKGKKQIDQVNAQPFKWLLLFWVGAYFLCSLNLNKDPRYVLPYLPVVSLLLAAGLTRWSGRWGRSVRWGTLGFATLLLFLNLFPIGGSAGRFVAELLSPEGTYQPYLGAVWPHDQAIATIVESNPYQRSTVGVLPSTPTLNQHNINYYGALANFQVYGRQVGTRLQDVPQDARSLDWFITKTGEQGSVPVEAQTAMVQTIEQSSAFQLDHQWPLPDGNAFKLYHRSLPSIEIAKINTQSPPKQIRLDRLVVPAQTPPGMPVPITYEWLGNGSQLQSGLVLLTWRSTQPTSSSAVWFHDHGIGMGALSFDEKMGQGFRVLERTAMLPPEEIPAGTYTLEATYLNRQTGETYPIAVPPVTLTINPTAASLPAPELDLVTQLRTLATALPLGPTALEPVFAEIGRIGQYDPVQDYTRQTEQALAFRLQQEPQNLNWAYGVALAQILQRDVPGAIAALQRVVQLDGNNPYAHAYLAFVYLYDLRPQAAEIALEPAIALNPNLPEIKALRAISALMQGKLLSAWHQLSTL